MIMLSKIAHPSAFLNPELTDVLCYEAGKAETKKELTSDQLAIIFRENWLNMMVPKTLGGLELSLPEVLKIEEGLAWADGSTAWVVTLCSGAAWFAGFLDPILSEKIFENEKACFAGSGAASGIATKTS